MNNTASNTSSQPDPDLWALASQACDGTLTPDEQMRLDSLLQSEDARQCFGHYMLMHGELRWRSRGEIDSAEQMPSIGAPLFDVSDTPWHSPVPSFSQGLPFCYLIATLVVGFGLLLGSLVPVSTPVQVVVQTGPHPSSPSPLPTIVGRITGIVNCRWAEVGWARPTGDQVGWVNRSAAPPAGSPRPSDGREAGGEGRVSDDSIHPSSFIPHPSSPVSIGDTFALSSGLMEITYDTGAKVVLQGPFTYEVDSPTGGYLSLGKLTARVEKKKERRTKNEELSASRSSFLIPHSYFAVRTPTATVTDLGTEFGVEVDPQGQTTSHVFRGKVEMQLAARDGKQAETIGLSENESARVEMNDGGQWTIRNVAATSESFVRIEQLPKMAEEHRLKDLRRWQTYSRQLRNDPALVAYYSFESVGKDNATLPNLSSAGKVLDGQVEGAEWVYGRLPGKFALLFHGEASGDKVVLPEQERFNFAGPFSVAVWFKVERFAGVCHTLIAKGDRSWRLHEDKSRKQISFDTTRATDTAPVSDVTIAPTEVDDGRWHLAVLVFKPAGGIAQKLLYMDGRLAAEDTAPMPLRQSNEAVWLGADSMLWYGGPKSEFCGLIDEVAIFARPLSAEEIATMFQIGKPAGAYPPKTSGDMRKTNQ